MTRTYIKTAAKKPESDQEDVRETVEQMLRRIEAGGEDAAREYAREFDRYDGNLVLDRDEIESAGKKLPQRLKDDIRFAYDNVSRFATAQKESLQDFGIEIVPGFFAGQKNIPCQAAGCYVPGGRYSHIASAVMTVTTANVAGCEHVGVCSPPRPGTGISPAIVYTADLCGADTIVAMGGVQAVASMAFGLFGLPPADVLVGPGNQYVAEAKRILFGRTGIDMLAGPTDSLIVADETADPELIAVDLVGQAEHGYNSPVWLVTDDRSLAERVLERVPGLIAELPELNRRQAEAAWRDYAEIVLCEEREEMAATADEYAPEHLSVHAADLDWWLGRLKCYGSLFLGEETTVAFGDKVSGPNHVLPTSRAARYTGGLSVHKYMKVVTWQRTSSEGAKPIAEATARISRWEGMEGHARSADARLRKFFPGEDFELRIESAAS